MLADKTLKKLMSIFQFFYKLCFTFICILPKHSYCALVLAGGE